MKKNYKPKGKNEKALKTYLKDADKDSNKGSRRSRKR